MQCTFSAVDDTTKIIILGMLKELLSPPISTLSTLPCVALSSKERDR